MAIAKALILLISVWIVSGQRPSFAGIKPIGFPEVERQPDQLGNRFGSELELPIEAKGDRDLVERISKWPLDKQPFWYINWKALEENRKNPQTYQPGSNVFNPDAINTNQGVSTNQGMNTNQGINTNPGLNTNQRVNTNQGNLNRAPQNQFVSPDASKGLTSKFGNSNNDDSMDDSDEDVQMNYNPEPYGMNKYNRNHFKH